MNIPREAVVKPLCLTETVCLDYCFEKLTKLFPGVDIVHQYSTFRHSRSNSFQAFRTFRNRSLSAELIV